MAISTTLRKGSTGDQVKQLQQMLGIPADGIFGPKTEAAVRAYQQSKGLSSDGIVGPKTIASFNAPTQQTTQPAPQQNIQTNNPLSVSYGGQNYTASTLEDANFLKEAIVPFLDQLNKQNLTVNPDLDLGPDVIAKILDKARSVVSPEYDQKIQGVIDNLGRAAKDLETSYGLNVADKEASFKENLDTSRENAAGAGTIFSGRRAKDENLMREGQDRSLTSLGMQYGSALGDAFRTAEEQVGPDRLSGFQIPNLSQYKASTSGSGSLNSVGGLNTGYTPGSYKVGDLTRQKESAALSLRNLNVEEASKRKAAGLSYADLYQ